MPAYMIVQTQITDAERFNGYRAAVMPLIAGFGGKHIRNGTAELLEGEQDGLGIALFEFASMADIHAFWNSPEYVPIKNIRRGAAVLDIWAVPG